MTISVEEITEERAAERRRAFALGLEDRLRAAEGAQAALDAAVEELGREMRAMLVGLSRLKEDGEHIIIESEWRAGDTLSTLGRHRLSDCGAARAASLGAGEAVVIADGRGDGPAEPDGFGAVGVRATIEVPLVRDGRLRGHVFVCDRRRRDWTEDEVTLVVETAERAWQASERARAEADLRDSEARFRQLAETIREVFYVYELDEPRMSYVSPAYEDVWGRPPADVLADPHSFMRALHPGDQPRVEVARARLWGGEPVSEEYRLLRPDGSLRFIHDRATMVTDPRTGRRRAYGAGPSGARRRTLLHHQGAGSRHGPGPRHGAWLRPPVRGRHAHR